MFSIMTQLGLEPMASMIYSPTDRRRAAGQAFKNSKICDKMYVFKIYLPCVMSIYFSIFYFIATVFLMSTQSRPFSTSNNRKAVNNK